ncbi:MAG: substrate-binding domain-containing protein [Butyrivibrio sp.]|nr:substrate-binding domain-containing protein [Butyrivibrio sp.]
MKKDRDYTFLVIVLALIATAVFSAYAMIRSNYNDGKYHVSVIVENSGDERLGSFKAGVETATADYNIQLDFVGTSNFNDLDEEMRVINGAVSDGADAVITELVYSEGTEDIIKEISNKTVLELAFSDADSDVDVEGKYAVISPDNYELGRALGNEVILRHPEDLNSTTIGILAGRCSKESQIEKLEGLRDVLEQKGAKILWQDEYTNPEEERKSLAQIYGEKRVDVMVALDDGELSRAAELSMELPAKPEIYGEGSSIKNIAYLDRGLVESIVVPDYFRMGYQSVEAVSQKITHKLAPMTDETVYYRIINRNNMFDEENQRYLFTVAE